MEKLNSFVARINLPNQKPKPIRAYVHRAGQTDVFDSPHESIEFFKIALDNLHLGYDFLSQYDFILAAIWGKYENKIKCKTIDFFGYKDIREWPGNPDVDITVITTNIWNPEKMVESESRTCGDSLIMLGEEEKYRRTTKDLNYYINNPQKSEEFDLIELE